MTPFLFAAWIACQSFDAVTTAVALHRPGVVEANPLMRHGGFAIRLSVNLGAAFVQRKTTGKTRFALPAAFAASGCLAGTYNLRQLSRR